MKWVRAVHLLAGLVLLEHIALKLEQIAVICAYHVNQDHIVMHLARYHALLVLRENISQIMVKQIVFSAQVVNMQITRDLKHVFLVLFH